MNYINITVRGKIARAEGRARVVCGNSDYAVRFDFDAEWEAYDLKTARLVSEDGSYTDVQFAGSDCTIPILRNTRTLLVGVFAGNLRTTTAALIHAVPCITDPDGTPADPTPDVYAQLMERFDKMEAPAAVLYTAQELTNEQKATARENIGVATPDWNQNDPTAADYVKNRTHYDERAVVKWNGDTTGLVSVGDFFYKISDTIPTKSELLGGTITLSDGTTIPIESDTLSPVGDGNSFVIATEPAIVVASAMTIPWMGGLSFTETGIYFENSEPFYHTSELVYNSVKQLDLKYIPEMPGDSFYIDLEGDYPNYICPVAKADIKAAYEAGKVLECRCKMGEYTATLPLLILISSPSQWIFSGAGELKEHGFQAQTFTVIIAEDDVGEVKVRASNTRLVTTNSKLPNPNALTITSGSNSIVYDGSTEESIDIPAGEKGEKGDPGVKGDDGITPTIGANGNWYIGSTDTGKPSRGENDTSLGLTSATVGQLIKIKAVDDSGKPTAWEAVDMPTGGGGETWELINEVTLSEDAMSVVFDKDKSGSAFSLRKFAVFGRTKGSNASKTDGGVICINTANSADDNYSIVPPNFNHGALKGDQFRYWRATAEGFAGKGWCWHLTGADNTWIVSHAAFGTGLTMPRQTIPGVATYLSLWSRTSGVAFAAGSKIELYGVRA